MAATTARSNLVCVQRDQPQRHGQRLDGGIPQFAAHLRAHDFEIDDLDAGVDPGERGDEPGPQRVRGLAVDGLQADAHAFRAAEVRNLRLVKARAHHGGANIFGLHVLGKLGLHRDAAGEVDRESKPAEVERGKGRDHEDGGQRVPHPACGHEPETGFLMEKFHVRVLGFCD
jgi:hypothetical protein